MRLGTLISILTGLASAALAASACTSDYQKRMDDPKYGIPNALANERQPGPSSEETKGQGGDGGSSSGGTPACVAAGGTLIDGGPCAVSFKTDVLGAIGAATPACTLASCHGGVTPPNPPRVDPGLPAEMYAEWSKFKMSDGKPYINPCSTDDKAAGLACNVAATGGCGSHMPQGGQMAQDAITKLETWLKCGSPNN